MAETATETKMSTPVAEVKTPKDPNDWATGDEPMTSRQRWFLKSLCDKLDVAFNEQLSKREASLKIERLRSRAEAKKAASKPV